MNENCKPIRNCNNCNIGQERDPILQDYNLELIFCHGVLEFPIICKLYRMAALQI